MIEREKRMTLKQLCQESHRIAMSKGFWELIRAELEDGTIVEQLEERNPSELLMLVVSELGEACEALRCDNRQYGSKKWAKDTYEDEIADCFIRLADLCEAQGIDIEWQISKKMSYNKKRPKKHGKKF
jgi:NTP pyrophosphatase (non-canonical NTP hydrolase)